MSPSACFNACMHTLNACPVRRTAVKSSKLHLKLQPALFRDTELLEKRQGDCFDSVHRQVHVVVSDPRQGQVERCLAVDVSRTGRAEPDKSEGRTNKKIKSMVLDIQAAGARYGSQCVSNQIFIKTGPTMLAYWKRMERPRTVLDRSARCNT